MRDDGTDPDTEGATLERDEPEPRPTAPVPAQRAPTATSRLGVGGRYELGREIGRGGMGEVLAARDEQIGREVAIKRMRQAQPSPRAMGRFFREASIQGRLDHPAIVPVHELGVDEEGRPFFAMKKLAGTTLGQLLETGGSRTRLLRAFADVCLAVEFAHTRGVVHRDLKPDNIILGEFGEVYVIDWGVAKVLADAVGPDDLELPSGDAAELATVAGVAIGTPGYMSPEQVRAQEVDARADVYALGCILFEILTGEMLHPRGNAGMTSALANPSTRPSARAPGRDIPPELDALCAHATAFDRDRRAATARELGERVQLYLDGDRDVGMRRQLAVEHLERARDAYAQSGREGAATDDGAARRVAMQEAGRALALDPKLAGAAELVSRLMLEPPRNTPPEVEHAIAADMIASIQRHSSTGVRGYLGYLVLAPLLLATGEQRAYLAALIVLVAANVMLLRQRARIDNLIQRAIALVIGNAFMVALLAQMFSPLVFAPAVAVVTVTGLVFGPVYAHRHRVVLVVIAMSAAVLLPWLGEELGWLPHAIASTADGLALSGPALRVSQVAKYFALIAGVVAVIASAAGMAFRMCSADRAARRALHLQAWQLRQLVPDAHA